MQNFTEKRAGAQVIKAGLASESDTKKKVQSECPKGTEAPCPLDILKGGAPPYSLPPKIKKVVPHSTQNAYRAALPGSYTSKISADEVITAVCSWSSPLIQLIDAQASRKMLSQSSSSRNALA
jgi:hypothetical protein